MIKLKKKITIIIGGGIAAYKSLELIRHLQSENFEIIPVLTKSASNFITSLSISAISKNQEMYLLFYNFGKAPGASWTPLGGPWEPCSAAFHIVLRFSTF